MGALGLRIMSCLGLVAAALAIPAPAIGEDLGRGDVASDVRFYEVPERSGESLIGTDVPRHRDGDIRRAYVRYGDKRIRIGMRFRELRRPKHVLSVQGRFRWPANGQFEYGEAVISATDKYRAGSARLTTKPGCHVRHRVRYAENRATMSFPARCIGSPRWIQFNAATWTADDDDHPTYFYLDSIYSVIDENDDGSVERYTRRIRRG